MSLSRSLPGSLVSSGIGTLPSAALPWEAGGSNASATGVLAGLVASLSGAWWDRHTGITIGTGVSAWVDRVAGKTLSQGTGSKQPAYSATTGVTSDGVDDVLSDASSNFLLGAPGYTLLWCGSTTGNTGYLGTYGTAVLGVYLTGGLHAFMESGAPFSEWLSGSSVPLARAVYGFRGQWSDGTTAQKQNWKNGAADGGSRSSSGNVSGGAFGSNTLVFFAQTAASATPSASTAQHIILFPSQISDVAFAQANALLHQIEGF